MLCTFRDKISLRVFESYCFGRTLQKVLSGKRAYEGILLSSEEKKQVKLSARLAVSVESMVRNLPCVETHQATLHLCSLCEELPCEGAYLPFTPDGFIFMTEYPIYFSEEPFEHMLLNSWELELKYLFIVICHITQLHILNNW